MRVLAIDPGPVETAWVIWDTREGIVARAKEQNERVSSVLADYARRCDSRYDAIAIEMIASYGMPVGAEVFETCVWIGRFMERAGSVPVRRITRGEVKMHLCHSMRAKDANVRQALIDKLGPPGTKKAPGPTYGISGDCWAALAVAVYASEVSA